MTEQEQAREIAKRAAAALREALAFFRRHKP